MTTREKAPTILTAAGARKLTARIRDALALADDLLVRAYEGKAWEALGHASWPAFIAAELPELRMVKLRTEVRREWVRKLLEAGASVREAAVAAGTSVGSAHNDARVLGFVEERSELNTPRAAEQPVSPPLPQVSNVDRAVALVAAQGARGLTVRELCHEADWHHGQASGALTKAHQRGLIARSDVYRDRCAAYLRP